MIKLALHRSEDFKSDFDLQYRWYLEHANELVAERYLDAVLATLRLLATQPELGRRRKFRHPALRDLRSFRVVSPFEVHLLFYRRSATELSAERLMYGGRDLPRRLVEPPGAE
jgi:plasmid stabilization system protein ParE